MDSLCGELTGVQLWLLKMGATDFMEQPPPAWQLRVLDALLACGVPLCAEAPRNTTQDGPAFWLGHVARCGSMLVFGRLVTAFPALAAARMPTAERSSPLGVVVQELRLALAAARQEEVGRGPFMLVQRCCALCTQARPCSCCCTAGCCLCICLRLSCLLLSAGSPRRQATRWRGGWAE